jgi:hypothetical protein
MGVVRQAENVVVRAGVVILGNRLVHVFRQGNANQPVTIDSYALRFKVNQAVVHKAKRALQ